MRTTAILREALVDVQTRNTVLGQLQTRRTSTVEAADRVDTVMGARLCPRRTLINIHTREIVRGRQLVSLWAETLEATQKINTLVTTASVGPIRHTLVDVLASQVVAAQTETGGTTAGEGSLCVVAVVGAVVQLLRTFVYVLAVELVLG